MPTRNKAKKCTHFWKVNPEGTISVCKLCGAKKKEYTADQVMEKKGKTGFGSGAGVHTIEHSKVSNRGVIKRIING